MTDSMINGLLEVRNCLMTRRDEGIDWHAVGLVEGMLCAVIPGQNNDVDLALGRTNATLPPRTDYGLSDDLEMTRRIWQETEPIEY